MKMLTRRGEQVENMGQTYLAEPNADGKEARPLPAAAIACPIALGPRARQKVLTLRRWCHARSKRANPCAPTSTGSICTPQCVSKRTTACGWNSAAVPSPCQRCRTNACCSMPLGRGTQAQDTLARRDHAPGDEPVIRLAPQRGTAVGITTISVYLWIHKMCFMDPHGIRKYPFARESRVADCVWLSVAAS